MRKSFVWVYLCALIFGAVNAQAVVGGRPLSSDDPLARHTVVLYWGQEPSRCTAVIVHPRAILTAAHCMLQAPLQSYLVVYTNNLGEALSGQSPAMAQRIAQIIPHPKLQQRDGFSDDLALLILSGPVPPAYLPARLPDAEFPERLGQTFTAVGVGIQNTSGYPVPNESMILKSVELKSVAPPNLENLDAPFHRVWAEQAREGICAGDSGGPSFYQKEGEGAVLMGINGAVSPGAAGRCAGSSYVTRVDTAIEWLREELGKLERADVNLQTSSL